MSGLGRKSVKGPTLKRGRKKINNLLSLLLILLLLLLLIPETSSFANGGSLIKFCFPNPPSVVKLDASWFGVGGGFNALPFRLLRLLLPPQQ